MLEAERVRKQLERLLASPEFVRAPRHSRFLTFIVEETLAGRSGELKEYVIATTVFEKPASFDPREDSTVRTEASKLRTRLDRYYAGPGQADEVRIELPRGGYSPVFGSGLQTIDTPAPPVVAPSRRPQPWIAAACLVLTLGAGALYLNRNRFTMPRLVSLSSLNTMPGQKRTMAFSPDGRRVAFSWAGSQTVPGKDDNWDIWVQSLDNGSQPKRLTSDEAQEWSPSWSPDGRSIAFVRDPYDKAEVIVVPADGGLERKLEGIRAFRLSWSSDGKSLVVLADVPGNDAATAVFVIDIETRARKQVTFPTPAEGHGHTNFSVSPNGREVAYVSTIGDGRRVMIAPLDGVGSARVVAADSDSFGGLDWAPDGKSLFVTEGESIYRLYSLPLDGSQRTPIAGLEGSNLGHFSVMRGVPTRIAASVFSASFEIWTQAVGNPKSARLLIDTEGNSRAPQYSSDGSMIAFLSDRSSSTQVWIAREDGTASSQLTSSLPCSPTSVRWHPGAIKKLIFDCWGAGKASGIYTVDAAGGKSARIEGLPDDATSPSYSADGKRVYFTSRRSGRYEVWATPADRASTTMTQITHNGAVQGLETADGESLIFLKELKDSFLWRLHLADGRETPLAGYAWRGRWEVDGPGVAVAEITGKIMRAEGEKREPLADIGPSNRSGFSIHPKKRQIVYGHPTRISEDLVIARFDR